MIELKNTGRARVVNTLDGRVVKCFVGPKAIQRFNNERHVLQHLNQLGCPFVPRLLDVNSSRLAITIDHCGDRVEGLPDECLRSLFDRLNDYGVRHDDPALRNVLYDFRRNEFTLIDFELAEIVNEIPPIVENID